MSEGRQNNLGQTKMAIKEALKGKTDLHANFTLPVITSKGKQKGTVTFSVRVNQDMKMVRHWMDELKKADPRNFNADSRHSHAD